MTPAATTPAGRGATKKRETEAPGHRRKLRQQPAPRAPRRVSGPLDARAGAAPRPRPQRAVRPARRGGSARALSARALAFARALPDHALLDRIVRGRAWIPLLGVMLAGIVAMQVEVLKVGASMGRALERGTALQSRNELLRESVASLADDQRIESLAAGMGMVMPAPDGVGFLSARSGANVQRAIADIHAPDAQGFLALISANGAVATASSSLTSASTGSSATTGASAVTGSSAATGSSAGAAANPATSPATAQPSSSSTAPGQLSAAVQSPSPGTPGAPGATTSDQAASTAGAAAPTQVAATQNTSSQAAASPAGEAATPTGG